MIASSTMLLSLPRNRTDLPTMTTRDYSSADLGLMNLDQALRTLFGRPKTTDRPNPTDGLVEADLDDQARDHTARLMRINHTGEVCAQGLYQGQALAARDPVVRESMEESAAEENDHLDWWIGCSWKRTRASKNSAVA